MPDSIAQALEAALTNRICIGELLVCRTKGGFVLIHRDDEQEPDLQSFSSPEDAIEIARYDDRGNYRPLKTAPSLRHGWRLQLADLGELRIALDHLYPGRLAVFAAWKTSRLITTQLRETLDRQTGMYRVAAKISDEQLDLLVANFCQSNGGCLRTILWKRDASGAVASTRLPKDKFDPAHDQSGRNEKMIPLLCQEACNLLVAECRKVVKSE
jgi:sirohydrochlorin cobaltochelatase